ncbi:Gfo/Idh/MocA family protein [Salsuginibacillus kocurii]|uniref:Gfo/Idh/MocA family protein n=1 Tax=Salsuginibacillus kocurii TaxID=427078 RepID=UPI00037543BD|nr:Gfo/Idh/MocA family oxidoreductase [Salsuginibacillus kocurii]
MTVKVGIVGCGSITRHRHAPEYVNNKDAEIVAFYDPTDIERAHRLAQGFGGRAVASLEEMLEDPAIDAVSDCSTNELHHIITSKALEHGKHVLCEKPIASTVEQAEIVIEAQKRSGKILMLDHNQRLLRTHQKAKEILETGEMGRVLTFRTTFGHQGPEHWSASKSKSPWFFKKDRSALGVAGDLGIHKVDLIRYLLQDEVAFISSYEGALDKTDEQGEPIEVCDNMVCIIKMESGALGTGAFSWTYYGQEDNSTVLYCEKGMMKLYDSHDCQLEIIKHDGETVKYELEAIQTNDNQTNSGVIDAFIEAVVQGTEPPVVGEDGLTALQIIYAAMDSSESEASASVK